jgi:hypothetical protein
VARQTRLKLTSLPGFDTDIYALPTPEARKMALDMLVLIREGKVRGVALGEHVQTGDLSDCYKLYFDPDGSQKPRFRLVYRYTPNEVQAIALEAVAVGSRSELQVYQRAAQRIRNS